MEVPLFPRLWFFPPPVSETLFRNNSSFHFAAGVIALDRISRANSPRRRHSYAYVLQQFPCQGYRSPTHLIHGSVNCFCTKDFPQSRQRGPDVPKAVPERRPCGIQHCTVRQTAQGTPYSFRTFLALAPRLPFRLLQGHPDPWLASPSTRWVSTHRTSPGRPSRPP